MRRIARWVLRALLAVFASVVLIALAIVAQAEWATRAAAQHPAVPPPLRIDPAETRPVLILLHGAGLNGHMWDAVLKDLDPRFRALALDLPGHGTRRGETFSLEGATATVVAAARAVAPAPVLLVGDSLGGYSAMAAAASLPPAQLRGLVLAGSSANFDDGPTQWLRYARDVVLITAVSAVVDEAAFGGRALGAFGVPEADRPTIVAGGIDLRAVPLAGRGLIGVDFRAQLAAIETPVLIVNGALDTRAVEQEASFVAAARQATPHRFENAMHGVSMNRAPDFARLLNGFAARVLSAGDSPQP